MGPTEGAVFEARISQLHAGLLPEHVAGLLWAYGRFGYRPGKELYMSLVAKGIAEAHNMSLAQCFNSLKGLARMATLKVLEWALPSHALHAVLYLSSRAIPILNPEQGQRTLNSR